jgi:dTMP kinase
MGGTFITLEGPEGSGKTLQMGALAEFLRGEGYPVFVTREPGGTPIGDQIRDILSDLNNTAMQLRTEILLFQASRSQLVEQLILPHLERGDVVLCDRYADSTLAYQGYGYQQYAPETLQPLIAFATGGLVPHLTLLLDVDVEEGLRRKVEGGEWNRMDAYDIEIHQRARQGYLEMARAEPDRWVVVDASGTADEVQEDIRRVVLARLERCG